MTRLAPDPEVLVVGGGPAGSTLAGLLALEGHEVLLVDRASFPREKACGECVNPGAVEVLRRLDLLSVVLATDPVPLLGWELRTPRGSRATARFRHPVGPALGVRREAFDQALLQEAGRRGVRVREGVHVQSVSPGGGPPEVRGRWVGGRSGTWTLRPRLVVGADGLRSVVARTSGARRRPPRRVKASLSWRLEGPAAPQPLGTLLLGGPFTAGLAPVTSFPGPSGAGLWTQTVVLDPSRFGDRMRSDVDGLREEAMRGLRPEDAERFRPVSSPLASGPFDVPMRWVARGSVLLVGDAAGYFDPLTGQGIFRALRSAEIAAPRLRAVLTARGRPADAMRSYREEIRAAFEPGRRLQRAIDFGLDRPFLRHAAVTLLSRDPARASTLVAVTGDRLPMRSLWSRDPGARVGVA